jgi:WD40 repeat protein
MQGTLMHSFTHLNVTNNIGAICYYSDEAIISANESGLVEFMNLKESKSDTFSIVIPAGEPTSIDYSATSNNVLIGCEFGYIYLYNLNNQTIKKYDFDYYADVKDIWFLDDPNFFLVSFPFSNETHLYTIDGKKLGLIPSAEYKPLTLNGFFMAFNDRDKLDRIIIRNIDEITKLLSGSKDNFYLAIINGRNILLCDSLFNAKCLIKAHEGYITDVALSPDNSKFISAAEDGKIRVWSQQGELLNTFYKIPNEIQFLAYSKSSDYFYAATYHTIYRVNLDGTIIPIEYSEKGIEGMDNFGDYYITLNKENQPEFVAIHDTSQTYKVPEYNKQVESFVIHQVLDEVYKYNFFTDNSVSEVVFSPDQEYYAILDNAPQVKVYSKKGTYLFSCATNNHAYNAFNFSPHSKFIAICTIEGVRNSEGKIYAYDEIKIFNLLGDLVSSIKHHSKFIFDTDDNYLLTFDDDVITRWKINPEIPGKQPSIQNGVLSNYITSDYTRPPDFTYTSENYIESTAFSEDLFWVAQSSYPNQIVKYSLSKNQIVDSINLSNQKIRLSNNEAYMLSFYDTLYLFETQTHELLWKQRINDGFIKEAIFTTDENFIITAILEKIDSYNDVLRLYKFDVHNGTMLATSSGDKTDAYSVVIRMLPNSNDFITGGDDQQLRYWDFEKFQPVRILAHFNSPVVGIECLNDGRLIYVALRDGTLYAIDANENNKPNKIASLENDNITAMTINSANNQLYIATEHNVHVFDPKCKEFVDVYCRPDRRITGVQCIDNTYVAVLSNQNIDCWNLNESHP